MRATIIGGVGIAIALAGCGGSDGQDSEDITAGKGSVYKGDGNLKIEARWKGSTTPAIEARVSRGAKSFTIPCTLTGYLPNFGDVLDTRISCQLGKPFVEGLGFEIAREKKGDSISYKLVNVDHRKNKFPNEFEILRGKKVAEDEPGLFEPKLTATLGKEPAKDPMALGLLVESALVPLRGQNIDDDEIKGVDYKMNNSLAISVSLQFGGDSELNLPEPVALRKSGKFVSADAIRALVLEQAQGGGPGGDRVRIQKALLEAMDMDTLKDIDDSALPAPVRKVFTKLAANEDAGVTAFELFVADLGTHFVLDSREEAGMTIFVFNANGDCVLQGGASESSNLTFGPDACVLP